MVLRLPNVAKEFDAQSVCEREKKGNGETEQSLSIISIILSY